MHFRTPPNERFYILLFYVLKLYFLHQNRPTRFLKSYFLFESGIVACTCNSATLEAELRNSVGSIPVGGNSPSIGRWIV